MLLEKLRVVDVPDMYIMHTTYYISVVGTWNIHAISVYSHTYISMFATNNIMEGGSVES